MLARFRGEKPAPADPTRIPPTLDASTTFFKSSFIHEEVRACVPLLHTLPNATLRSILQKIIEYVKTKSITDEEFISFQKSVGEKNGTEFGIVFTGLYVIFRAVVGDRVTITTLSADLKRMNFPAAAVDDICRAIMATRSTMQKAICVPHQLSFPRLQKLRWRIDVAISSGSLSRIMRPSILMQMILSNGSVKTFEVSIKEFNQLRYGVAKILYDMQTLERHPIMKLVKENELKEQQEINK